MTKRHILLGTLLCSLALPCAAMAYLSPEEVISDGAEPAHPAGTPSQLIVAPPPTRRQIDAVLAAQMEAGRRLRDSAYASSQASFDASDPTPSSASSDEQIDQQGDPEDQAEPPADDPASGLSERQARILERVQRSQDTAQLQAQIAAWQNYQGGNVDALHGGAPLEQSGMGTIVAVLTLIAAGVFVMVRARKSSSYR